MKRCLEAEDRLEFMRSRLEQSADTGRKDRRTGEMDEEKEKVLDRANTKRNTGRA
jgi:hypothetical protein